MEDLKIVDLCSICSDVDGVLVGCGEEKAERQRKALDLFCTPGPANARNAGGTNFVGIPTFA